MIFLQDTRLIEEKLRRQYENFLKYCKEAGKRFVDELDKEDFIAYRSEYSVAREQIAELKKLLDFQEQRPAEKISPLKNVSGEMEESLQKYFKITDLAPYENILVAELDFNARVQHCLKRNGYRTLAELLRVSKQDFFRWKEFGQVSLAHLLATLQKFFAARRKSIPITAIRLANEELDEFLRDAALNHDSQIDLIIAAFENFSASVTMKNLFRNLPDEIKNKRARPFLRACGLEYAKFFKMLPEDLTLANLAEYVADNNLRFEAEEIKNFVEELRFEVRACTKKIIATLFKNDREFDVVRRRAKGATLDEIGKNLGVTRERVRQIESKSVKMFMKYINSAKKIFYFLHALTDGKSLLTLNDAKNFLDAADAEMFWFFAAKIDFLSRVLHFDKEINSFVFDDGIALDENELIKNLPDVMEENIFEEAVTNLAREKNCYVDLIKIKLAKFYERSGKIFYRGRLTLTFKCAYVLKERFQNGYKIADETFYSRFVRYLREIFDEKASINQRALDAIISRVGFLCDRGKYIHPDFVHISPKIIERVKNFIDESDRTAIFYKEIFESLKNIFVDTQITNHYFLQGAIKFYELPYILRKDYLTKSSEIDMGKEFDNFVAERGEVSFQEIKENFISFKDFNIAFLVGRCSEIIRVGDGSLIHASRLNLKNDESE